MRNRLNQMGVAKGLSITLPASYWYLRGFDIVNLEQYVDFFNIMTYDIREYNTSRFYLENKFRLTSNSPRWCLGQHGREPGFLRPGAHKPHRDQPGP